MLSDLDFGIRACHPACHPNGLEHGKGLVGFAGPSSDFQVNKLPHILQLLPVDRDRIVGEGFL